jgi:hypothetical protein
MALEHLGDRDDRQWTDAAPDGGMRHRRPLAADRSEREQGRSAEASGASDGYHRRITARAGR